MLMNMPYSPETKSAMRQEIAIRKQDAIDFENKTGKPLVRETNLAGRIYKPFLFSENKGMFDEIIAKENSGLKTDFEAIQEDATKFNRIER